MENASAPERSDCAFINFNTTFAHRRSFWGATLLRPVAVAAQGPSLFVLS